MQLFTERYRRLAWLDSAVMKVLSQIWIDKLRAGSVLYILAAVTLSRAMKRREGLKVFVDT